MSRTSFVMLILLSTLSALIASEHKDAKEMFDEAACMRCHNDNSFQVRKERIDNFEKLYSSVQACARNTHAGWFEEDMHKVSRYLNHEYYKMPQPPAMEE
jgi:cytochrome c553